MFNRGKIKALEKKIADLEARLLVGTGDFDERRFEVWGFPCLHRTEKQIDIQKAIAALLDHLGMKIVVTAEKTETTPEHVTLSPIAQPSEEPRKRKK